VQYQEFKNKSPPGNDKKEKKIVLVHQSNKLPPSGIFLN